MSDAFFQLFSVVFTRNYKRYSDSISIIKKKYIEAWIVSIVERDAGNYHEFTAEYCYENEARVCKGCVAHCQILVLSEGQICKAHFFLVILMSVKEMHLVGW